MNIGFLFKKSKTVVDFVVAFELKIDENMSE